MILKMHWHGKKIELLIDQVHKSLFQPLFLQLWHNRYNHVLLQACLEKAWISYTLFHILFRLVNKLTTTYYFGN
jgi:hypothetical protein